MSKDVGAWGNGAKKQVIQSIPLHIQELNYRKGVYELEGHVGEKVLNSYLLPKLGPSKKTSCKFF